MYTIKKLSNGIPVVMENIPTLKSVTIGTYVKTGAKYEHEGEHGISHLLEHMLFKGTETRTARQISEVIDNIGGNINAFTSKEITSYYVTVIDKHVDTAIDVLSDIFINSTFISEELEKEKNVVIEEIRMYEDVPEEQIHDINSESVLKGGGTENSVLGTEKSVKGISREKLVAYYKERYTVDNTIIAVAGNFDTEKVLEVLEEKFGILERKLIPREYNNKFYLNSFEKNIKKDTNQIHLCVNTKGISYLDDRRYVISVISNVLGGSMSSRLFQEIREDRGLAYSVYSYLSPYEEGGMFTIYAGTTKENYHEVIDIIKREFNNIKNEGIFSEELEKAKNQILSSFVLGMETSKSRMSRIGNSYLSYGRVVSIEEITEKIEKITLEDVKKLAEEILDNSYHSVTVLGDVKNG